MSRQWTVGVGVAALGAILCLGCGGGSVSSTQGSTGTGGISGVVVKGPIANGKVTAYRLGSDFRRGEALASTITQEGGAFSLSLPSYNGHLLVVVSSGSYVDEATGLPARLDGQELTAVVTGYRAGTETTGTSINAVSHWVAQLASFYISKSKAPLEGAVADARSRLHAHFGNLDWSRVVPTDFNTAGGATLAGDAERAGLLNAALSQQALGIALTAGFTPGGTINALTLISALGDDLAADGYFDGVGARGVLRLPADGQVGGAERSTTQLGSQTVRLGLASSVSAFLQSSRNLTAITPSDALGLANALSNDPDITLFRSAGSAFDDAAPIVTLDSFGDLYQSVPSLTLTAQADDGPAGSGVKAVYARSGDTSVSGVLEAGLWKLSGLKLAAGVNTVTVWAEDKAAHSGRGQGAPFEVSFRVFFDDLPPSALRVPFASYVDERGMRAAVNEAGRPLLPAQWEFDGGKVEASDAVYKSLARSSWGPQAPTGQLLEADNPFNTPFVQVAVPFNPNTDSPLVSVDFCLADSCSAAVPSARSASGQALFDLPISSDNVAEISKARTSPIVLPLRVLLEDAAGNKAESDLGTLSYHLVGSPIVGLYVPGYEQDVQDPRGVRHYRLNQGTLLDLYRRTNPAFAPGHGVRFQRYLLMNPASIPVTVVIDAQGTSLTRTTMVEQSFAPPEVAPGRFVAPDGTEWPTTRTFNLLPFPGCPAETYACSSTAPDGDRPIRVRGGGTVCNAFHPLSGMAATQEARAAIVAQAFISTGNPSLDSQLVQSPADGPYRVVLPAATESSPGLIEVYLGRDKTESFLDFSLSDFGFVRNAPLRWNFDAWNRIGDAVPCCLGGRCMPYRAERWVTELAASNERVTGTLRMSSYPSVGDFTLTGLPGRPFQTAVDVAVDH